MQKKFIILGLTGPIGSGCGDIAEFVANGVSQHKDIIRDDLKFIENTIAKHFKFIYQKTQEYKQQISCDNLHNEDELENIYSSAHPQEVAKSYELKLKAVNRNLRELLIRRKIYRYFLNNKWETFYPISMSTLLVKLILTNIHSAQANSFFKNNNIPDSIFHILKEQTKPLIDTIKKFDR